MKKAQFTKPLTVPLPPEVFLKIKEITDEREIGMAEWVRDAVKTALDKIQEKEDAMR
jgi:hypothetical protein